MHEIKCKHCGSPEHVKNGFRNGKQNRICKKCGKNFTQGDKRCRDRNTEKAVCLLLYALGKCSMRFLGNIFQVSTTTILLWLNSIADEIKKEDIESNIKEIEIDEMWHYVKKNPINYGYLKLMIVKAEELLPMLQEKEILKVSKNYMKS